MFETGKQYHRRRDIHALYGGQEQGGIITPSGLDAVLLVHSPKGKEFGYTDGWRSDGAFQYTGEGTKGDMVFERGNRAVRDHVRNGKRLFLFENIGGGYIRCEGEFEYVSYAEVLAPDSRERIRKAILFILRPIISR